MCQPGSSLAQTWYITVSPARASAGLTEGVSVTSLGLIRGLLSFFAGLASAACAGRGMMKIEPISAAATSVQPDSASGREGAICMAISPMPRRPRVIDDRAGSSSPIVARDPEPDKSPGVGDSG